MTDLDQLAAAIDGLVHPETQVGDHGVDLTVAAVADHDGPGRVDFGGGELEPAVLTPRESRLREESDRYGWWHLDPGGYLIEYNEGLAEEGRYLLQPRQALCERGAFHPTMVVDSIGRMPIFVGSGGLRLKENARVSTLLAWPG